MQVSRKLDSSNYLNQQTLARCCVLNDTLFRVGMRWKMQVLYCIEQGVCSFGALKREPPGISDHVLGKRLRELQAESLVDKDALASYSPAPHGRKLLAIMQDLCSWELESSRAPAPSSQLRRESRSAESAHDTAATLR